jgi:hypothetical protein
MTYTIPEETRAVFDETRRGFFKVPQDHGFLIYNYEGSENHFLIQYVINGALEGSILKIKGYLYPAGFTEYTVDISLPSKVQNFFSSMKDKIHKILENAGVDSSDFNSTNGDSLTLFYKRPRDLITEVLKGCGLVDHDIFGADEIIELYDGLSDLVDKTGSPVLCLPKNPTPEKFGMLLTHLEKSLPNVLYESERKINELTKDTEQFVDKFKDMRKR